MKTRLQIIALLFPQIIWGQFYLLNTPYQDEPFADHTFTIGVANQTLDLGSNANLGRWNGTKNSSNEEVFAFSEWNQEMLRVQYQYNHIKWGYHASFYSYQTRSLSSELFDILFENEPPLAQNISFRIEDRSSFTHSVSARIGINQKSEFIIFANLHQINSYTQRLCVGQLSNSDNITRIDLTDQTWSFNSNNGNHDDVAIMIPNDISAHDSVHITTVFNQPVSPSVSFKFHFEPTPYSEIVFFANNLGFSNKQWITNSIRQSKINIATSTITTGELINGASINLDPWTTNIIALDPDSARIQVKARPTSVGGQFKIEFQPKVSLIAGASGTRYPTYLNFESLLLTRLQTSDNSHFHLGIGSENIQRKWMSNFIVGATLNASPMITYSVNTTTGLNYAFANSNQAPRTISRMNYYFSLEITLP